MLTALIVSAALQTVPHVCGSEGAPTAIADWNAWANSPAAGRWYGRTINPSADPMDPGLVEVVSQTGSGRAWIGEADGVVFVLRPRSECDSGRGYSAALIDADSGEVLETAQHLTLVTARYNPVVFTDGARRD